MQYYSLINSVVTILGLILISLIVANSKISKDLKFGIPFWIVNIGAIITLMIIAWDYPKIRIGIIILSFLILLSIYLLHFRKRDKTNLDYWKLAWLIFYIFDNTSINIIRYTYITGMESDIFNKGTANFLDLVFDISHVIILTIILIKINRNKQINKNALQHAV